MIIRRIAPGEAALWRILRLEARALAPVAFATGEDDWAGMLLRDFAAEVASRRVFVALAGSEAVGCISWSRDTGPLRHPQRGWIEGAYVTLRARGQGLGGRLIAAALADAAAAEMCEIRLEVAATNARARAAYARAGFVPVVAGISSAAGMMIMRQTLRRPGIVMRLRRKMSIFATVNGKLRRAARPGQVSGSRQ